MNNAPLQIAPPKAFARGSIGGPRAGLVRNNGPQLVPALQNIMNSIQPQQPQNINRHGPQHHAHNHGNHNPPQLPAGLSWNAEPEPHNTLSFVDTRIPVTILTGPLGAGKTTILKNTILKGGMGPIFVLENDVGAGNIDADLLGQNAGWQVKGVAGGCACCTKSGDLKQALHSLLESENQNFVAVVIELSGVADPKPIMDLFEEDSLLSLRLKLDAVLCVADSRVLLEQIKGKKTVRKNELSVVAQSLLNDEAPELWEDGLDATGENQIKHANRLFLNKLGEYAGVGKMEEEDLKTLRKHLQDTLKKPAESLMEIHNSKALVPLNQILDTDLYGIEKWQKALQASIARPPCGNGNCPHSNINANNGAAAGGGGGCCGNHNHGHHHHSHGGGGGGGGCCGGHDHDDDDDDDHSHTTHGGHNHHHHHHHHPGGHHHHHHGDMAHKHPALTVVPVTIPLADAENQLPLVEKFEKLEQFIQNEKSVLKELGRHGLLQRMKGFVRTRDNKLYLIQGRRENYEITEYDMKKLPKRQDGSEIDAVKLVFIGKYLDKQRIQEWVEREWTKM
ncbi:unnamed protein product [Amoebophrya sp. A120]|nr:unnamed protein product [Amoebophrya sp. A120]|eukprot:GSA120T00019368001.1